jgi:hypothetical protein
MDKTIIDSSMHENINNKPTEVFTETDCIPNSRDSHYYKEILILNPDKLKEEYKSAKYQLWLPYTNTFGCDPELRGKCVKVVCLADGEKAEMRRSDFLGICRPERIPKFVYENGVYNHYVKDATTEDIDNTNDVDVEAREDTEDCL